jgi:hypothetical protein
LLYWTGNLVEKLWERSHKHTCWETAEKLSDVTRVEWHIQSIHVTSLIWLIFLSNFLRIATLINHNSLLFFRWFYHIFRVEEESIVDNFAKIYPRLNMLVLLRLILKWRLLKETCDIW